VLEKGSKKCCLIFNEIRDSIFAYDSQCKHVFRETNCIEVYCPALIDLLELCLSHFMTIVHGSQIQDSPHCKIVLEILSALFLNHNKTAVMTLAVPATFALFERTDSESLINTAASYLSLSALHNGKILAQYAIQLIKNVLKGNLLTKHTVLKYTNIDLNYRTSCIDYSFAACLFVE
jgi:hypothetical protein